MMVNEIKRVPTDEENKELIRKYRETGDEQYREAFFQKNAKLPYQVAHRFQTSKLDFEDRVAIANFGMFKAFENFNIERDIRFATYSYKCMENEIFSELKKLKKSVSSLSLEEGISKDKNGNVLTFSDSLKASAKFDIEIYESKKEFKEFITLLLQEVSNRERAVLLNMLGYTTPLSGLELAKSLCVTPSYIAQLKKKIAKKARKLALRLTEQIH